MFTKLIDAVRFHFRAREAERALNALSDEALADIGLTRAGIADLYVWPAALRPTRPGRAVLPSGLAFPAAAQAA